LIFKWLIQKSNKRKVEESVESAFGVLRKRIDQFGVTQPNSKIRKFWSNSFELPVQRCRSCLLSSTAQFWETYKIEEMGNFLMATMKHKENKITSWINQ
jgi:SecD/SecF fusion protein